MPCISYEDYKPESDNQPFQDEIKAVISHLMYIHSKFQSMVPNEELNNAYMQKTFTKEEGDKWTAKLCKTITGMNKAFQEKVIYDGHSKKSRKLADWWENHQEQDRFAEMQLKLEREKADYKQALKKLSSLEPEDITRFIDDIRY